MNINKISMGLLFLILALVIVPGASANPEYKPGSNGKHISAAAPDCAGGCHDMPVFCKTCHAYPYATATPVVTATTVAVTSTPAVTAIPTVTMTPKETKEIPKEETQETTEAKEEKETPGFGIVSSIVGLFALFRLKRNTK